MATRKPKKPLARRPAKTVKSRRQNAAKPAEGPLVTGPARSRRFGWSVNLNFGQAGRSCHWNCIYCPWHDRKPGKTQNAPSLKDLIQELGRVLQKKGRVDTVILGGNSEPTLFPEFPELVQKILELRTRTQGTWSLIALTNGSGLTSKPVRKTCSELDQVWIKLDCAQDPLFRHANRPDKASTAKEIKQHLDAIKSLEAPRILTTLWKYPDKTPLQNWSAENLAGLLEYYGKIKPLAVHLTTLRRDKRLPGVRPVSWDEMESFALRVADLGIPVEVFP